MTSNRPAAEATDRQRAFRGLIPVFFLSFLNLAGVLLTITALGGLDDWTRPMFVGLFGIIETASGLACIYAPNVWRLPAVELDAGRKHARLAISALVIAHWGGAARCLAGIVCLGAAAYYQGLGLYSITLPAAVLMVAVLVLAGSALVARIGVAWPEIDVVRFTIGWRNKDHVLPPISISASILQFFLSILPLPAIGLLKPGALYQPELAPSLLCLALLIAAAVLLTGITLVSWAGRLDLQAPRWQQREAERNA